MPTLNVVTPSLNGKEKKNEENTKGCLYEYMEAPPLESRYQTLYIFVSTTIQADRFS
jgi:hypothetical protein